MIKVDGMEVTVRGKTSKILSNLEMLGMTMRQVEAPKGALLDAFITGLYGDAGNKVDSARVIYGEVKIGDPDTTTKGAAEGREDFAEQLKKAVEEAEKIIRNSKEGD